VQVRPDRDPAGGATLEHMQYPPGARGPRVRPRAPSGTRTCPSRRTPRRTPTAPGSTARPCVPSSGASLPTAPRSASTSWKGARCRARGRTVPSSPCTARGTARLLGPRRSSGSPGKRVNRPSAIRSTWSPGFRPPMEPDGVARWTPFPAPTEPSTSPTTMPARSTASLHRRPVGSPPIRASGTRRPRRRFPQTDPPPVGTRPLTAWPRSAAWGGTPRR
jgi:hypothetical protein